jgi:hypothetical protein
MATRTALAAIATVAIQLPRIEYRIRYTSFGSTFGPPLAA